MVGVSTLGCHVLCFIQYLKRIEWKNNLFNVKCYIWWALVRKDNRWIIFRKNISRRSEIEALQFYDILCSFNLEEGNNE